MLFLRMKTFLGVSPAGKRGSMLLIVLMFLVVISVFAVLFLEKVIYSNRNFYGQLRNDKAFYLAEAGFNKAIWYLLDTAPNGTADGSWRTAAYPAVYGSGPTDPQMESLGGGTYTMWVVDSSAGSILIVSSGKYEDVTRIVHQRVTLAGHQITTAAATWGECSSTAVTCP